MKLGRSSARAHKTRRASAHRPILLKKRCAGAGNSPEESARSGAARGWRSAAASSRRGHSTNKARWRPSSSAPNLLTKRAAVRGARHRSTNGENQIGVFSRPRPVKLRGKPPHIAAVNRPRAPRSSTGRTTRETTARLFHRPKPPAQSPAGAAPGASSRQNVSRHRRDAGSMAHDTPATDPPAIDPPAIASTFLIKEAVDQAHIANSSTAKRSGPATKRKDLRRPTARLDPGTRLFPQQSYFARRPHRHSAAARSPDSPTVTGPGAASRPGPLSKKLRTTEPRLHLSRGRASPHTRSNRLELLLTPGAVPLKPQLASRYWVVLSDPAGAARLGGSIREETRRHLESGL